MTELRGRTLSDLVAGLNAGQHLAVDAVVAFVDGELEAGARDRAVSHIGTCPSCAAEVAAQRQARSAVRSAAEPAMPAGLLAALRSIPERAELPTISDGLAVTADGTVVLVTRQPATGSAPATTLGSTPPLGSTTRLGGSGTGLGGGTARPGDGRRGTGTVVSGLVLGALIMVTPGGTPVADGPRPQPPPPVTPVVAPGSEAPAARPEPPPPAERLFRPPAEPVLRPVAVVPEHRARR
jgi:hypothetical protein